MDMNRFNVALFCKVTEPKTEFEERTFAEIGVCVLDAYREAA